MKGSNALGMRKTVAAIVVSIILALVGLLIIVVLKSANTPGSRLNTRIESEAPLVRTSAACRDCHQAIYDSYVKTGHFRTSSPADKTTLVGDFGEGHNVLQTQLAGLSFKMEARQDGFYQTAIYSNKKTAKFTKPIDVVVGSGERGQTFFYWEEDGLFQLPVTYITPKKNWILSPGYDQRVDGWQHLPGRSLSMFYQRPVGARCIECHANSVTPTKTPAAFNFLPESFEFGIGCEKCHGPGENHIAFHQENPGQKEGVQIVNPARLSRSQQLSSCALCHAGQGVPQTPPLSFKPGDEIADHRYYSKEEKKQLSVHGGQVPFLEESRCFLESGTMTCSTCHNVHEDQTDRIKLFSKKCLSCHQQSHPENSALAHSTRCTECHMPNQEAGNLTMFHQGDQFFLTMANHRIGIFKEQ
jgi:hypothetical protein